MDSTWQHRSLNTIKLTLSRRSEKAGRLSCASISLFLSSGMSTYSLKSSMPTEHKRSLSLNRPEYIDVLFSISKAHSTLLVPFLNHNTSINSTVSNTGEGRSILGSSGREMDESLSPLYSLERSFEATATSYPREEPAFRRKYCTLVCSLSSCLLASTS